MSHILSRLRVLLLACACGVPAVTLAASHAHRSQLASATAHSRPLANPGSVPKRGLFDGQAIRPTIRGGRQTLVGVGYMTVSAPEIVGGPPDATVEVVDRVETESQPGHPNLGPFLTPWSTQLSPGGSTDVNNWVQQGTGRQVYVPGEGAIDEWTLSGHGSAVVEQWVKIGDEPWRMVYAIDASDNETPGVGF